MKSGRLRRIGAKAKVCLLLGSFLLGLFAKRAQAAPFVLAEQVGEPGVVVYPAQLPGARRVTIVLHGMCSEPVNACRHFAAKVTADEHLICPRASVRCEAGGSSWPQRGFIAQVERAVARAEAALGERVDSSAGRTLVGYSLGAFRALEMAEQGAGKYPRLMLIGAKIFPSQKRLRDSGVERLLLSAGAWDMMHEHMRREARRLERGGFNARFLDLGPAGHFFTPTFGDYLPEALAWLDAEP